MEKKTRTCHVGHLVAGDNAYWRRDGYSTCRECLRRTDRENKRRLRESARKLRELEKQGVSLP